MKKNKGKGGKGSDVIKIGKEDWKGGKKFPVAPGGKYRVKFDKKSSKIVPNAAGTGNLLLLVSIITSLHNGKKTEHKGIRVFDRIAPHVGWKIAQVLKAMGVKKAPKKMTLKELLAMILKYNKEIREVIGTERYQGKTKNNVSMYLPLAGGKDEDDDDIEDDDDLDDDEDSDEDSDDEDDDEDDEDDDSDDDDSDDSDDDDDDDEDDEDDEDEDEDEDDDDDEDEDDDEEDDEDDRPRSKKSKKSKSKKRKARR